MNTTELPRVSHKVFLMAVVLLIVACSAARATQISVNLGPAPQITSHVQAAFSNLNGTHLQGQTLSLDFSFANNEFGRLFSVTSPSFEVMITLQTNGSGLVGFLDGTGYLLDRNGNEMGTAEGLGSASGNDGSMSAGLFPLLSGQFTAPLDFFGMHTDLVLPHNSLATITGGEFQLVTPRAVPNDVFGIGPGVPQNIVPDSGTTSALLSVALGIVLTIQRRLSRVV